jgi:hypothetical protein
MTEVPPFFTFGCDFFIIYRVGQAILTGGDPYAVYGSYYPPAASFAFGLFALVPPATALIIWTFANAFFLVRIARGRAALAWLWFYPVAWTFVAGQVDLLFVWLATYLPEKGWKSVVAAALLTLKPQLGIVLLAWWGWKWLRTDRRKLAQVAGAAVIVQGLPILFRPELLTGWLHRLAAGGAGRLLASSGIWTLAPEPTPQQVVGLALLSLTILSLGITFARSETGIRATLLSVIPFTVTYDSSALVGAAPAWLLVPLSWLLWAATKALGTFVPLGLLPVVVLLWQMRTGGIRLARRTSTSTPALEATA